MKPKDVRAALETRLAGVRWHEAAVLESADEDAVHDMRVAARRLRAALDLLLPDAAELERGVKQLQDALGKVRDAQVLLAGLSAGSTRAPAEARLKSAVRALPAALRRWQPIAGQLAEAMAEADRVGDGRLRRRLVRGLDRVAERLQTAASAEFASDEAHRLRIAVKKLRYAGEVAGAVAPGATRKLLARLERLQELLGELHDLDARMLYLKSNPRLVTADRARRGELCGALGEEAAAWEEKRLARRLRRKLSRR